MLTACGGLNGDDETGNVTVTLPNVAGRSISQDVIKDLKSDTVLYRVHMNERVLEGTGGNFYAYFAVGLKVDIYIECLNSSGVVIIRTNPKTIVVANGGNSVDINLQTDGIVPPQSGGGSTPAEYVNIIFNYGFMYDEQSNTWMATPEQSAQQRGLTLPQGGQKVKGAAVDRANDVTSSGADGIVGGIAFRGWIASSTVPSSSETYDTLSYVTTYTGDMTLYAIWEKYAEITFTDPNNTGFSDTANNPNWTGTAYVRKGTEYELPNYTDVIYKENNPNEYVPQKHTSWVANQQPYTPGQKITIMEDMSFGIRANSGVALAPEGGATITDANLPASSVYKFPADKSRNYGDYYIWENEPFILPSGKKNDGSDVTEWELRENGSAVQAFTPGSSVSYDIWTRCTCGGLFLQLYPKN